jgi:hypothetical protein
MKKTKLKLFLFLILFGITVAHAQTFQWAKRIGSTTGTQSVRSSTTDAAGNIYLTGLFTGTVDFDPGAATFNLISSAGSQEVFICKLSAAGAFIWAKSFSGSSPDWPLDIAVDATGNVYTVGLFQGTVDFDPGAAVSNITTFGGTDGFLCKLSNLGNLVWVRRFGSTGVDRCQSVAIDAANNIYISGYHGATFDADPSPSVFNIGGSGSYLIKLSSLGNFIWARQPGGSDPRIAVDGANNIYIAGEFSGTVDFDPIGTFNLTSAGNNDVFVSKLTAAGAFVWAKRMGGIGNDMSEDIAVDAAGNAHTIGLFDDVCDFDPGTGVFNITSIAGGMGADMFVSKLNSSGNFAWAKSVLSPNGVYASSIDLDATGNVYMTGNFNGTVDFNTGAGVNNLVASTSEGYLLKLSPVGNYVWAYDIGATTAVNGLSITIDAIGGIIASGAFTGTGDFNPYSAVFNLTSNANLNMYVLKLYVSPLPIELLSFNATQNKNAVDITWQTSTETNNHYFTIEKSKDGYEFEEIGKVDGAGNSNTVLNYALTDENPYPGISFYRLKQTDFNGEFSYSEIVAVRLTDSKYSVLTYPNPFHDKLNITISTMEKLSCLIILKDLAGRILLSNAVETEQDFNSYEINAGSFTPGVYLLEVKSPNDNWITKVVLD